MLKFIKIIVIILISIAFTIYPESVKALIWNTKDISYINNPFGFNQNFNILEEQMALEEAKLNLASDDTDEMLEISPFETNLLPVMFGDEDFRNNVIEEIYNVYDASLGEGVTYEDYLLDFLSFAELMQKATPDNLIATSFRSVIEEKVEELEGYREDLQSLYNIGAYSPVRYLMDKIRALEVITLQDTTELESYREELSSFLEPKIEEFISGDLGFNDFFEQLFYKLAEINNSINEEYSDELESVKEDIDNVTSINPDNSELRLEFTFNPVNFEPVLNLIYRIGNTSYRLGKEEEGYTLSSKFEGVKLDVPVGNEINFDESMRADGYDISTNYIKDGEGEYILLWSVFPYMEQGLERRYYDIYSGVALIEKNKSSFTIKISGFVNREKYSIRPFYNFGRYLEYYLSDADYGLNLHIENFVSTTQPGWAGGSTLEFDWYIELLRRNTGQEEPVILQGETYSETISY